jgi:uncharacterized membrane protein YidH (DUF202 family)
MNRYTGLNTCLVSLAMSAPQLVFAQGASNLGGLNRVSVALGDFVSSTLLPLVLVLALFIFCFGIFRYFIVGSTNQDARDSGKALMIWGILGLVIIVAVWGIVNFIIDSFLTTLSEGPSAGF